MHVFRPEMEVRNGRATISARVVLRSHYDGIPDTLWFSVPEKFTHLIQPIFEPFVVGLSTLAAISNEDIDLDGALSERLSVGLAEYWKILSTWEPKRFKPIGVNAEELTSGPTSGGCAAAAFSGGVDSFFTQFLNRERPVRQRSKYAVFIHGFDIPLFEEKTFEDCSAAYEAPLREDGVELIRMSTNVRSFIPPDYWEMGHGSALCGAALALSGGIDRFFIPSSKSYLTLEPWGSDPLIDGLLSTDRVQIVHDGAYYTRFDKINLMKEWDPLRNLLRTCYEKPAAFQNCGECQNCRRTMMVLASLGVLKSFPTFPADASAYQFAKCRWETPHERLFGSQAIAHSIERRQFALACAGIVAMKTSSLKNTAKKPKRLSKWVRHAVVANLASGRSKMTS